MLDPILRWAGSKRWALPRLREIYVSHRHRRLVEPFVGSMAVALGLCPDRALLADVNPDLVALHNRLRDPQPFESIEVVTAEQYMALRDRFNESTNNIERGELFYALNRTCFNGLSRYNKNKGFNVPWGKRTSIILQREFPEHAAAIKNWEIIVADFSKTLSMLQLDDFLYIDSPYDGTFSDYAAGGFTWDEQERLAVEASVHTGPVVASNSSTDRILELYQDLGFTIELLDAPRRISSNGNRASVKEMLATKNTKVDNDVVVRLTVNSTVSKQSESNENDKQETGELEMANLPKGWGQQVANAEATIQRQNGKDGDYVLDLIELLAKDTQKGPAIIVEHKIFSAKVTKDGVEPMLAGSNWGYFLAGYGKAKVMQFPNMKSYIIKLFGVDENKSIAALQATGLTAEQAKAKFANDLGETIDAVADGKYRGMRIRAVLSNIRVGEGADEHDFTKADFYTLAEDNTPELIAQRAATLAASTTPVVASAFAPTAAATALAIPGVPVLTVPALPPSDPLAAAVAAGWKEHPQSAAHMYLGNTIKSKADIVAGR